MSGTLELCKITQSELAERLKVSQSYVANKLRLLSYSGEAEKLIVEGGISERHARTILRIQNEEERLEMLKKVISGSLSVRECEALVDLAVDKRAPDVIAVTRSPERIETFLETLKNSVKTLHSLGVEISETRGYYGNKMYITLCISDI